MTKIDLTKIIDKLGEENSFYSIRSTPVVYELKPILTEPEDDNSIRILKLQLIQSLPKKKIYYDDIIKAYNIVNSKEFSLPIPEIIKTLVKDLIISYFNENINFILRPVIDYSTNDSCIKSINNLFMEVMKGHGLAYDLTARCGESIFIVSDKIKSLLMLSSKFYDNKFCDMPVISIPGEKSYILYAKKDSDYEGIIVNVQEECVDIHFCNCLIASLLT